MQLFYATRDGQSRRIAERIASRLAERGISSLPRDLAAGVPTAQELAEEPLAAIVMAVRYGRHLPEGEAFLAVYRALRDPPPLVLLSVNLTARKPGKDTAQGCAYLRKSIARHRLTPSIATAFAGRLDYSRYGWLDRHLIRFIMMLTGGPTDLATRLEFTAWNVVDDVAGQIADLHGRVESPRS